jgi:two-component system chemotaxis sensor kinase CheA
VLGSGDLALILDPGAIALKAGVAMAAEQEADATTATESTTATSKATEYLVVDVAGRQAAVSLNDVLRIEQLPVSRIEYIRSRPVLNFEGQIVPVEDVGGVLTSAQDNPSTQIVVVVCRERNRQVGIVVSHVLDVAAGDDLHDAGSTQLSEGVTLLKNRVTDIVDLGVVAPLQKGQCSANEWSRLAEEIQ